MNTRWGEGVWAALIALADRLATIGPAVFVMITLIVLGLLAGALLRAVVSRLARAIGFDRHMERWGIGGSVRGAGVLRAPSDVLGLLFFWATFVIFASLGIDSLGFGGSASVLGAFLPPRFPAVLVPVVRLLLANLLNQGLLIAAV